MFPQEPPDRFNLKSRTKSFAVRVLRLCRSLSHCYEAQYLRRQLVRSAASVAANYRAACRARSRKEFISKISIVVEECDEAAFWMEFSIDMEFLKGPDIQALCNETNELTAIFVASRCTARRRLSEAIALKTAPSRSHNPEVPQSHIPNQ